MDKIGKPKARVWSPKIGGVATIRRKQLNFTFSPQAVQWIKGILKEKIDNQIALLLSFYPEDEATAKQFDTIINRLSDYKTKIDSVKGDIISEVAPSLRGWEGSANRQYFNAINLILPEQYRFEERTQHPARDVLMLCSIMLMAYSTARFRRRLSAQALILILAFFTGRITTVQSSRCNRKIPCVGRVCCRPPGYARSH